MNYYHCIEKIEASIVEELQEMYELLDPRNKGYIDSTGLVDAMKSLGYEVDKKQVTQMIEFLDEGNKGVIPKESFLKFMTGRMDYRDDPEDIRGAFDYFDQLGKGSIRLSDLARVAQELGEDPEECKRIMAEADKDEDGTLNYDQFMRVIRKTSYL